MSRLSNLFGSNGSNFDTAGDSFDGDALKYSAPKEPKAKLPATISPHKSNESKPTTSTLSVSQNNVPSKILSSATIRLYKLSLSNGYEMHENGQALGFVILGSMESFQLLVYNGQKVPQVVVPLTPKFQYTTQDLYMSFSDPQGISWSTLFDSLDAMKMVIRSLVLVLAHLCNSSYLDDAPDLGYYREILPGHGLSEGDELPLSSGMSAGIYYSAWELGNLSDYPTDKASPASQPLFSVQPPADLMKVRIGSNSDEIFPGFNELLIGCKKGQLVCLAVSPRLVYASSALDLSRRAIPSAWMIFEIEIVKAKSTEKKKKNDDSVNISQPSLQLQTQASATSTGSSDIAARMAHLSQSAAGSGATVGMGQLAQQMLHGHQLQNSYPQSSSEVSQFHPNQPLHNSQPLSTHTPKHFEGFQTASPIVQHNQMQPQSSSSFSQSNQRQQSQIDSFYSEHYVTPQTVGGALTVVSGQEARSYYLGNNASTQSYSNHCKNYDNQNQQQQVPQNQHSRFQSDETNINLFGQQNNPLMVILQSVNALHYKIDNFASSRFSLGNSSPIRVKADEIVQGIQSMITDYEKAMNEANTSSSKDQLTKLQDKLDNLQLRYEKIMSEKATILEKQSDILQRGVESSSRVYSLQQEIDDLKREKQSLFQRIDELNQVVYNLTNQSRTSDAERLQVTQLQQELSNLQLISTQTESEFFEKLQFKEFQFKQEQEKLNSSHQVNLMELKNENSRLCSDISLLSLKIIELESKLRDQELNTSSSKFEELKSELIQGVTSELSLKFNNEMEIEREKYSTELSAAKVTIHDLTNKNDNLNNTVRSLTIENGNMKVENSSTSQASGKLDENRLKSIMQDIYTKSAELFLDENDENLTFQSKDIMKRIRMVLKSVTAEYSKSTIV